MNLRKLTNFQIVINGVMFLYKYLYKAFGFNMVSDFELSGLIPGDGPPEVEIIRGQIELNKAVEEANVTNKETKLKDFFVKVADIAECYVTNGAKYPSQ